MNDYIKKPLTARNGFLLALLFSLIINLLILKDLWWNPGQYIFNDMDDGIKNYYTVYYHAAYDSSATWFQGMNYPEGEHVLFTDNQPIFSTIFQYLVQKQGFSPSFIPGAMNWLVISSLVIGSGFLWLCFVQLGFANIFTLIAAILISNLPPQLGRMGGHYALAYSYVIPVTIYLWLKIFNYKKPLDYFLLFLFILFISLVHLYYGLILFFLVGGLSFVSIIYEKSRTKEFLFVILLSFLPLILIKMGLALTDPIIDRPDPWGFLHYRSAWEGIFLPLDHFPATYINKIIKIRTVEWEGIAYVGIPATVFFFSLIFLSIKFKIKKTTNTFWGQITNLQKIILIAGILNLLFAMGLPFILWLEWLVPYLGPLKQFRSIGRFAWNFYYAVNLVTFIWIFINWNNNKLKTIWIVLSLLMFGFHIYDYRSTSYNFLANKSKFNEDGEINKIIKKLNIQSKDYQAIWPIPYFHIGSETINRNPICYTPRPVLQISWLTGIPTNGVVMSRTSLSQTNEKIGLHEISDSLQNYLSKLKNKTPFLVVQIKHDCDLNESDSIVIAKSERIYADVDVNNKSDSLIIYKFEP